MKKTAFIFVVVLAVILVLSFFKDVMIKASVENGVELITGLKLKMQNLKVGIINTLVSIKNLRLFNPAGYPDKIMLNMPEIYIDYDLPAVIKGKMHFEEMRIDMREFVVVKNAKGELNLNSLKVVKAQKEGKSPQRKGKGGVPEIQIDSLRLKIGKVVYKDYSRGGGAPFEKEFNISLDERYENITDPYSLVSLIVVKALTNTSITNLTGFDLNGLQGTLSDTLLSAQKAAVKVAVEAQEKAMKATQKTTEIVEQTTDTLKKTTESLKGIFKSSFDSSGK